MQTIIFYIVLTIHSCSPFGSFPTESLIIGAVTRIYPIISYRYVTHYTYHWCCDKLDMEDAQRLQAKRRGFKSGVTKLLAKISDATSMELERVNPESVTPLAPIGIVRYRS